MGVAREYEITGDDPPSHNRARWILNEHGIGYKRVIHHDEDAVVPAILFLDHEWKPAIAWKYGSGNLRLVMTEPGFPSDPTDEALPRARVEGRDGRARLEP